MGNFAEVSNIVLGLLSLLALISGFLILEYQVIFWIAGGSLLIFAVIGYYVSDNREKINKLYSKFNKIEETLNVYNRLNKIELSLEKMSKKAQINLIEIIKWGLAIIIIWAFIKAITNS